MLPWHELSEAEQEEISMWSVAQAYETAWIRGFMAGRDDDGEIDDYVSHSPG